MPDEERGCLLAALPLLLLLDELLGRIPGWSQGEQSDDRSGHECATHEELKTANAPTGGEDDHRQGEDHLFRIRKERDDEQRGHDRKSRHAEDFGAAGPPLRIQIAPTTITPEMTCAPAPAP